MLKGYKRYGHINQINFMIEEGLYDSEPNYVRATIYEKIFKRPPLAYIEIHDALVNRDHFFEWIKCSGFKLFHCKLSDFRKDGEERAIRYYINKDKKTILIYRRQYVDPSKEVDILSTNENVFDPPDSQKKNPNRISYFCIVTDSEETLGEFKKIYESFSIKEDTKNQLYMLKLNEYNGLELDSFPTDCGNTSLELNYGAEFQKTYEHILTCINTKKSGLYIFHGPAGTGKTTFIKYLTTTVEKRKFIFVPNALVAELFSPKMVDKLYSLKNSVLVLEDAEVCVFKRDGTNNELVSGILNITDGLLKDLLNISIIVTFNAANINELDSALLRKGRLKIMHKFDLLSVEDAKRLANHLGKKNPILEPTSLADVYNLDEDTGIEELPAKKFGFG